MIVSRRIFWATVAGLGVLAALSPPAGAQGYPDHPIKLIVPFAAGGNADINGRLVGEVLQKALGQAVVVE
ncbi:MAG: tripartite tricarboxylate transporter substrate binding protein, partial [Hyphomicrobiaceae bacterium]|nr:tripartite tricarboxylate transporter substrate binding protein [Hyphomicrobiaceae bacterium]